MPRLIVLHDTLAREREVLDLTAGEYLSSELLRLWPHGIDRQGWKLYEREINDENELEPSQMVAREIAEGDVFILVLPPGTVEFWINLALAILLSVASRLLMPKPRKPKTTLQEEGDSANNQIAGQSNLLRPGARIPDILGRVRSYPDLLCAPVEQWAGRQQSIKQFFVVSMGDCEVTDAKLGETPITAVAAPPVVFAPGVTIPAIQAVRIAPDVNDISLLTEDDTDVPLVGVTFESTGTATGTLTSDEYIPLPLGPIFVTGTVLNDDWFWLEVAPSPDDPGPYVYELSGPVADEGPVDASVSAGTLFQDAPGREFTYGTSVKPTPSASDIQPDMFLALPGDPTDYFAECITSNPVVGTVHGPIASFEQIFLFDGFYQDVVQLRGMDGALFTFTPSQANVITRWRVWSKTAPALAASPPGARSTTVTVWTDWHTAPMKEPDEIWVDIAFPQGLVWYHEGERRAYNVGVSIEFRRRGDTGTPVVRNLSFNGQTQGLLRWTATFIVSTLALPAGDPWIEVRVRRTSDFQPDSATEQYIADTRWARLTAMRIVPGDTYPCTIVAINLQNTSSASSLGETAFNCIATRRLPTWDGSTWSTPAPSHKWADNFVQRCKASDGAARTDADIDLAGIYALQAQLDVLDEGAQGEISMTLDQMQDVDSELASIADVVRAGVYRVGHKIFVTRDQQTDTRIALFNGRNKSADAEAVAVRTKDMSEHDGVLVHWVDPVADYKQREYTYPSESTFNVLRTSPQCANWAQAYRRALFEYARIQYRRKQLSCPVTLDGRICRPGDVVNVTDDIGNLACAAGEVIEIAAGNVITLDRNVSFVPGHTYSVLLRDVDGITCDSIPCTQVAADQVNKLQLSRAPIGITIKARDASLGTLYAFFDDTQASVQPWLLTSVEASGASVQLAGVNYTDLVYAGDTATLEPRPPLLAEG